MIEIKMPRLSDTMEEGAISTWRKQPGDAVKAGDVLMEVETDKASVTYESEHSGTLLGVRAQIGESVAVGAVIAGPLPPPFGQDTTYCAAVMAGSVAKDAAVALIAALTQPDTKATWTRAGFELP